MNLKWHGLVEIDQEKLKYTIIISKYKGKYILIRNKSRTIWELPGGKREDGESILESARRELYEETGAIKYDLDPAGVYSLNEIFGMVYFAEIHELASLPDYEIAEIRFADELPEGLNYENVYYEIILRWLEQSIEKS